MMFVGDKGKILAGFHVDSPRLIPERRMSGDGRRRRRRRAAAAARRRGSFRRACGNGSRPAGGGRNRPEVS